MAYFNYHSKIQKLVEQGKLSCYYFCQNYNKIGFALVLVIDGKNYPIREHKFDEYFDLIGRYYSTKKVGDFYHTTFQK